MCCKTCKAHETCPNSVDFAENILGKLKPQLSAFDEAAIIAIKLEHNAISQAIADLKDFREFFDKKSAAPPS